MNLSVTFSMWSRARPFQNCVTAYSIHKCCQSKKITKVISPFQHTNKQDFGTFLPRYQLAKTSGAEYLFENKTPLIKKIIKKFGLNFFMKNKFTLLGFEIYEKLIKNIDYIEFIQEFELEDTFHVWFRIVELHIWMLSVRVMRDEEYGKNVRDGMIRTMWTDIESRSKHLSLVSTTRSSELSQLSDEFRAALLTYDEGLTSDKILAGAVWRRFFSKDCDNPILIERMVHYIRKQMYALEQFTQRDLYIDKKLELIPLADLDSPVSKV